MWNFWRKIASFSKDKIRILKIMTYKGTQPTDPLQFKWVLDMLKYGQK